MQTANLSGPLKGYCLYKALIGLTQASGLAGGFDWVWTNFLQKMGYRSTSNQGIRPDVEMLGADNSHRSQKHSWRSFAEFLRFHFLCCPLPFLLLEKFSLSRFVVLNTFCSLWGCCSMKTILFSWKTWNVRYKGKHFTENPAFDKIAINISWKFCGIGHFCHIIMICR